MRNLSGSRVLSAAIVVIVLGGLYALAGLCAPISVSAGVPPRAPHSVPVTSVVRACPAPGASRGGGIAVMAAPASVAAGQASPRSRGGAREPAGGPGKCRARADGTQHHQARHATAGHGEPRPHRPRPGRAQGETQRHHDRVHGRPGRCRGPGHRIAGPGPGRRADRRDEPAHRGLRQPWHRLLVRGPGAARRRADPGLPDERQHPGRRRPRGHLHRRRAAAAGHRQRDHGPAPRDDRAVAGAGAA